MTTHLNLLARQAFVDGNFLFLSAAVVVTGIIGLIIYSQVIAPLRRQLRERTRILDELHRQISFDELTMMLLSRLTACSESEIDEAITDSLRGLGEFLRADHAYILRLAPEGASMSICYEWRADGVASEALPLPMARKLTVGVKGGGGRPLGQLVVSRGSGSTAFGAGDEARIQTVGNAIGGVLRRKRGAQEARRPSCGVERPVSSLVLSPVGIQAAQKLQSLEERWQAVLLGSNDGIWDLNIQTGELYYSDRCKEMLGYRPDEIADTREAWAGLVCDEDKPRMEAALEAQLNGATEVYAAEYRLRAKDGSYRWIRARGRTLRCGQGRALRIAGSQSDITELKTITLQLAHAQQQADSANRVKNEFLANMNHEIRTPMNSILGMALLLAKPHTEEEHQEYLRLLTRSSVSLLDLLTQVLDLSMIRADRLKLDKVTFPVRECLSAAVNIFSAAARQRRLELRLACSSDVPDRVMGDPVRLQQVLFNLIDNAIKFTDSGTVSVHARRIETEEGLPDGAVIIQFEVRDSGMGISGAERSVIFEPFYQSDGSRTRRHGGSGIGLAICAHLVEGMGGRIWVESEPGIGSSFCFTASFDSSEPAEDESPEEADPTMFAFGPENRRPVRVLLAEDNPVNQKVAAKMLEKHGHAVVIAPDGQEAVKISARSRFDLILMDLHMPRMDGLQATKEIRRRDRSEGQYTPIWAVTASTAQGDQDACFAAGMDGFMSKPIQASRLLRVIQSIAERRGSPNAAA